MGSRTTSFVPSPVTLTSTAPGHGLPLRATDGPGRAGQLPREDLRLNRVVSQ